MKDVIEYIKGEQELIDLEYELIEKMVSLRKEKGLSQRDLCKLINMKQPYLVKVETKKVSPSLNTLVKILSALDCKIEIKDLTKK